MNRLVLFATLFLLSNGILANDLLPKSLDAADWQPKRAPLMTNWSADVSPESVHPEYPRPQLVREHWLNLNGLWEYAILPKESGRPTAWEPEQILVPFPVESALSGVMRLVGPEKKLWYRRTFSVPMHEGKIDPAWANRLTESVEITNYCF